MTTHSPTVQTQYNTELYRCVPASPGVFLRPPRGGGSALLLPLSARKRAS